MTYGFEREFFVLRGEQVLVAADEHLPFDGCGYLAEARGQEHTDPVKAAYLLLAEQHRIEKMLTDGARLETPGRKLDRSFKHACSRKFGKRPQSDFSMSGKWNSPTLDHAGLHVHFGRVLTYTDKDGRERTVGAGLINIPAIVHSLNTRFKTEIKDAKRALGLYKLNSHGFEYRSLPATLDPIVVAEFIYSERGKW